MFENLNWDMIWEKVLTYGVKIIVCLIIFIVGMKIINVLTQRIHKTMTKKKIDETVIQFSSSLIGISLKVVLVVSLAGTLGAEATSFVAILGAVSFAVGMALQGSLSNFAAGVILLILRPFKVGDYVEAAGNSGSVASIEVFSTTLKTPDNKTIIIPNGSIIGSNIVNYSLEKTRRVDFTFGVGYDSDIKEVKNVLMTIAEGHPLVLNEPEPFVGLSELGDSALGFSMKVWVNSADYWTVFYEINEIVKDALDQKGINIPYPHLQIVKE